MARANVPKFGDWGNDDNVPYTVYFDKARKNKGGKMINPNDPEDNPDMFPTANPPHAQPRMSNEDTDLRKSPARGQYAGRGNGNEPNNYGGRGNGNEPNNYGGRGNGNEPNNYGGRGQRPARPTRPSGGSEMSFERSPLHQAAKGTGRGGVSPSPAWEGRNHDSGHGTPGRSRPRPVTDESPDDGSAVPKFGEWESAENFTEIFQKHRDEKSTGNANVLGTPKHQANGTPRRQNPNEPKKCCFPWW